jgi:cytochrome c-type biogenesis protein
MTEVLQWIALPIGLGLFGFIEPCSIGSSLLFIKTLEGKSAADKLAQVSTFAFIRALAMGLLGLVAVFLGGVNNQSLGAMTQASWTNAMKLQASLS